ncbi:MAG: TetR/AcrR family transcriptional regulator [Anaerolineales bacterium]|jgi:AcrR family transcriptional regulator|nr:TetR/AcrR family transcriptional regulator [Anaerolineales bacterium]
MDKTDRRVKRTQKLLQEALIALTLEKGYDHVTIRDITDRADVGYATFFRHYPDKDHLLEDVLEAMKDEFLSLLAPYSIITDPQKTGSLIFEYVQANRELCQVLLNSTDTMSVLKPVLKIGLQEETLIHNRSNRSGEGVVPTEIAIHHLMTSLVMLIRWWLENDMPYPPERMGQIAAELIIQPTLQAMR